MNRRMFFAAVLAWLLAKPKQIKPLWIPNPYRRLLSPKGVLRWSRMPWRHDYEEVRLFGPSARWLKVSLDAGA